MLTFFRLREVRFELRQFKNISTFQIWSFKRVVFSEKKINNLFKNKTHFLKKVNHKNPKIWAMLYFSIIIRLFRVVCNRLLWYTEESTTKSKQILFFSGGLCRTSQGLGWRTDLDASFSTYLFSSHGKWSIKPLLKCATTFEDSWKEEIEQSP